MKITSQLAFKHDYASEFGGELGKRIHKHFRILVDGETLINPSIKWEYSRPNEFMLDTCLQDDNGYIFIHLPSRKACHEWIEANIDRFTEVCKCGCGKRSSWGYRCFKDKDN